MESRSQASSHAPKESPVTRPEKDQNSMHTHFVSARPKITPPLQLQIFIFTIPREESPVDTESKETEQKNTHQNPDPNQ
jgi:hypothetical protein